MKDHLQPESLSAYLDGELEGRERSTVEQHLASCAECSALRSRLGAAMGSVGSLGPVAMTADEHRVLRQTLLKSRAARSRMGRFGFRQWALAGGLVMVTVTALAFSFLRDGGPVGGNNEALTQAGAPSGGPRFIFDNPAEVDRTVAALPEVAGSNAAATPKSAAGGASQSQRNADAGTNSTASDSAAGTAEDAPPMEAMGPANEAPESADEDAVTQQPASGDPFSPEEGDECLSRVASTQSYPMVPLLAEEALYQGRPAWLLVYGWGPKVNAGEPADRWQSWLVEPDVCRNSSGAQLEERALYRSYSGAE